MGLENIARWTRSKLSRLTSGDVRVTTSSSFDCFAASAIGGAVALPLFDLFENESEFYLVVDVPGATASNTRLVWNGIDTLSVHVLREVAAPGVAAVTEYEESSWYREIYLSPDAEVARARSRVQNGVLTVRIPKRLTLGMTPLPAYTA